MSKKSNRFMSSNYANVTNECGKLEGTETRKVRKNTEKHGKISSTQQMPRIFENSCFFTAMSKKSNRFMPSNYANVTNGCGKLRITENTEKCRPFTQAPQNFFYFFDIAVGSIRSMTVIGITRISLLSSNYANVVNECKKKRCETYFTSSVWRLY
jgi:hypothetical protein